MKMPKQLRRIVLGPPRPDHTPVLLDVYDYATALRIATREGENELRESHDQR